MCYKENKVGDRLSEASTLYKFEGIVFICSEHGRPQKIIQGGAKPKSAPIFSFKRAHHFLKKILAL